MTQTDGNAAVSLTRAVKAALKWLLARNGDGCFGETSNNAVLLAAGDRAPIMRSTWTKLEKAGMVERYGKRRLRVTEAGRALDLTGIEEPRSF